MRILDSVAAVEEDEERSKLDPMGRRMSDESPPRSTGVRRRVIDPRRHQVFTFLPEPGFYPRILIRTSSELVEFEFLTRVRKVSGRCPEGVQKVTLAK